MATRYVLGASEIRPDERRLLVDGSPVAIGARAFDLLVVLIEHRDRVVGKAELMDLVWPGVVVEENNLSVQISALRRLLGAQAVATVPGRGYRFVLEVRETGGESASPSVPRAGEAELSLPDRPSIAVLPFDNLAHDPAQDPFVDGVTEEVITELSRFRSLFVIARNSTFSYKGRLVDVRTIARELGVRYVVEGSIRSAAGAVRVAAQLVDAETGSQLWAEKYDRALEDIFVVQEELTRAIVGAVAPQIESSEFRKARRVDSGSLNAYGLAMRARDIARGADREAEPASPDEAWRLASEAAAIDPGCGAAFTTMAYLRWREVWSGAGGALGEAVDDGLRAARCAIAIDGGDHAAYLWKGMLLLFCGQHGSGLADLRRAHELNRNDALTLSLLGQYEAGAGDPQHGIRLVTEALRLSPRDTMRWSFLNSLAWARFAARDYPGAADAAQQAIDEAPRFHPPHVCLAVATVGLGDVERARHAFQAAHGLAPQIVATRLAGQWTCGDAGLPRRATVFLRIAAGSEDEAAAAGLR